MPKPTKDPRDCSHSNAHKEVIAGQRTGEWICEACGGYWASSEALQSAQQRFESQRKKPKEYKMTFQQLLTAPKEDVADTIEQIANDKVSDLVNGDILSGLTSQTNAFGWGLDTLEVDKDSINVTPDEIICTANARFTGDQDVNSPPCGDVISGTVTIKIDPSLSVTIEDEEFELDEY